MGLDSNGQIRYDVDNDASSRCTTKKTKCVLETRSNPDSRDVHCVDGSVYAVLQQAELHLSMNQQYRHCQNWERSEWLRGVVKFRTCIRCGRASTGLYDWLVLSQAPNHSDLTFQLSNCVPTISAQRNMEEMRIWTFF